MSEKAKRSYIKPQYKTFFIVLSSLLGLLIIPIVLYRQLDFAVSHPQSSFDWQVYVILVWLYNHFFWLTLGIVLIGYFYLLSTYRKWWLLGWFLVGGFLQIAVLGLFGLSSMIWQ